MQTVIETRAYLTAAKVAGMTAEEMTAAVDVLASTPDAGEVMVGTKGFRKLRVAGKGHGKSGGYRLVTYFAEPGLPVVLITVFAKGDRPNLTKAERNALAASEPALLASLRLLP